MFELNEYIEENFENLDLSFGRIDGVEFDGCDFKNCKFNECVIESCKFKECTFEESDVSLLKIKNSIFNDVTFKKCKAIGLNWSLVSEPYEMSFYDSNISMSSFYRLNLKKSNFISCIAHEVDFVETNLENANFENTDLLNSIFEGTNLKNSNLSSAKNYTIDPQKNMLKGAKVSIGEAISFLQFLDVKIIN